MTRSKRLLVSIALLAALAGGQPVRADALVYGNPTETRDPHDPSNKGINPRVVDADRRVRSFALRPGGGPLYYGTGAPMRTPRGEPVRVGGAVRLNYGMRLDRGGRT